MKVIDAFYQLEVGDRLLLHRDHPSGQIIGYVTVKSIAYDGIHVEIKDSPISFFSYAAHVRAYYSTKFGTPSFTFWLNPSDAMSEHQEMQKKNKTETAPKWRNSRQLKGVKSQLTRTISDERGKDLMQISLRLALNLLEVCDQAIKTEEGHGQ